MSFAVPALFEINTDTAEATGTVYHFCTNECRRVWGETHKSLPGFMFTGAMCGDYVDGTKCMNCDGAVTRIRLNLLEKLHIAVSLIAHEGSDSDPVLNYLRSNLDDFDLVTTIETARFLAKNTLETPEIRGTIDIATGPVMYLGKGSAIGRVVLRKSVNKGKVVEFFTHNQFVYSDGTTSYSNGNYYPVRSEDGVSSVNAEQEQFKKALGNFYHRIGEWAEYPPVSNAEHRRFEYAVRHADTGDSLARMREKLPQKETK